MPENKLMPPYGVEDFEKLRQRGFYYVDKTGLIKEILENSADVTLFTRPRRFGKSLNMWMLRSFFEIGRDPTFFDGLAISKEKEICERYMGKYPVIFIKLSNVAGPDFETAELQLWDVIVDEAGRLSFLR
ncbi:MAG: AAA family ATPase, partial [Clostridiales bacterium]|nr:AAA family ATPase [Clostridiales bacterium]